MNTPLKCFIYLFDVYYDVCLMVDRELDVHSTGDKDEYTHSDSIFLDSDEEDYYQDYPQVLAETLERRPRPRYDRDTDHEGDQDVQRYYADDDYRDKSDYEYVELMEMGPQKYEDEKWGDGMNKYKYLEGWDSRARERSRGRHIEGSRRDEGGRRRDSTEQHYPEGRDEMFEREQNGLDYALIHSNRSKYDEDRKDRSREGKLVDRRERSRENVDIGIRGPQKGDAGRSQSIGRRDGQSRGWGDEPRRYRETAARYIGRERYSESDITSADLKRTQSDTMFNRGRKRSTERGRSDDRIKGHRGHEAGGRDRDHSIKRRHTYIGVDEDHSRRYTTQDRGNDGIDQDEAMRQRIHEDRRDFWTDVDEDELSEEILRRILGHQEVDRHRGEEDTSERPTNSRRDIWSDVDESLISEEILLNLLGRDEVERRRLVEQKTRDKAAALSDVRVYVDEEGPDNSDIVPEYRPQYDIEKTPTPTESRPTIKKEHYLHPHYQQQQLVKHQQQEQYLKQQQQEQYLKQQQEQYLKQQEEQYLKQQQQEQYIKQQEQHLKQQHEQYLKQQQQEQYIKQQQEQYLKQQEQHLKQQEQHLKQQKQEQYLKQQQQEQYLKQQQQEQYLKQQQEQYVKLQQEQQHLKQQQEQYLKQQQQERYIKQQEQEYLKQQQEQQHLKQQQQQYIEQQQQKYIKQKQQHLKQQHRQSSDRKKEEHSSGKRPSSSKHPSPKLEHRKLPKSPSPKLEHRILPKSPSPMLEHRQLPKSPSPKLEHRKLPKNPSSKLEHRKLPKSPSPKLEHRKLPKSPSPKLKHRKLPKSPSPIEELEQPSTLDRIYQRNISSLSPSINLEDPYLEVDSDADSGSTVLDNYVNLQDLSSSEADTVERYTPSPPRINGTTTLPVSQTRLAWLEEVKEEEVVPVLKFRKRYSPVFPPSPKPDRSETEQHLIEEYGDLVISDEEDEKEKWEDETEEKWSAGEDIEGTAVNLVL